MRCAHHHLPSDLGVGGCDLCAMIDERTALQCVLVRHESALRKIAVSKRPDGTYNLSREACEQIAKEALDA